MSSININSVKSLIEKELFKNIHAINDRKNKNELFNIFQVLGVQENEVIICRFLGELLDPKGSHGMKEKPLKLFIKNVLQVNDETDESLMVADVALEEPVKNEDSEEKNYRRVDIAIHTDKRVYPIEVKIWAGDQPKQLYDYYHYYFDEQKNGRIYYLTVDGHSPSQDSKGNLLEEQYTQLSFTKDIANWIEDIINICDTEIIISSIKQFKTNIENLEGTENMKYTELTNNISFTDNNSLSIEDINTMSFLCHNAKEIIKDIQIKYLYKYIVCNGYNKHSMNIDNAPKPNAYVSHSRLYFDIDNNNSFLAWASVDDCGLYLITNIDEVENWNKDKGCSWVRIYNQNNEYIALKDDYSSDEIIDITEYLNQALEAAKKESSYVSE